MGGTLHERGADGAWRLHGAELRQRQRQILDGIGVIFAQRLSERRDIREPLVQSTEGFTDRRGTASPRRARTTANCWVQYNAATVAANGIVTPPTLTYNNIVMSAAQENNINTSLRTAC